MDLFIKIIGYAALTAFLLVVLLCAFIGWKWRALKAALKGTGTPLRIKLLPDPKPTWFGDKVARQADADYQRLGYTLAGHYIVEEIPGVQLAAYCHEQLGIHAAYYNHSLVGRWSDLCIDFVGGPELTVGNAPQGGQLDRRPGTEKHFLKSEPLDALHTLIASRIATGPTIRGTTENFVAAFEAAYARDMDWRTARNGISAEEFQRIAETTKHGLEPERWPEAFNESKLREFHLWAPAALIEFEKVTTLSVAEWKKFEGNMLIYRDDFHAPSYVSYLGDCFGLESEATAKHRESVVHGLSLRGCLARMAEEAKVTWRDLGQVDRPQMLTIIGYERAEETSAG
jgi:hypothetical protein